jgi:hypothetical protein
VDGGVMVVYGDVVMLVSGMNGGAMVVSGFMIAGVAILMMGEVRSPCCHSCETKNNKVSLVSFYTTQATKQNVFFLGLLSV